MDIRGVAETNVNWTEKTLQEAMVEVKLRFGQGQVVGISGKSTKEGYLPGGTALVAKGKITGRIIERGSDVMGRFVWIKLNGKNNKQVMIILAYRVCKYGTNIGPHTVHMQQVKYLLLKGVTSPNPR